MARGSKKSRRQPGDKASNGGSLWPVIIVAVITITAGIIALVKYGDRIFRAPSPVVQNIQLKEVNIFFSDEEGERLKTEKRMIGKGALESEIKGAIEEIIAGPRNAKLGKTLPHGTRLLKVYVKDKTLYADFSGEIMKNHGGGSSGELQSIYSIVDTVTLNFPDIRDVQILVEGKKQETLAGHIDISLPLGPDKKIIS